MDIEELQRKLADHKASMFSEGIFDHDEFTKIHRIQGDSYPEFHILVMTIFSEQIANLVDELDIVLMKDCVDFMTMDALIHKIKDCSSSLGAQKVTNVCIAFVKFCEERNFEECQRCLQQLKDEHTLVKNKLEQLFSLEKQIVAAGGSIPME